MIEYSVLTRLWREEGIRHLPMGQLAQHLDFDLNVLSVCAAMPAEVPVLLTTHIGGDIRLFSLIRIEVEQRLNVELIVLGSVPRDPGMLYCLDCETGAVLLLCLDGPSLETVNSDFTTWVEFLYRLQRLLETADSRQGCIDAADALERDLARLDPIAFADPESWWSTAFGLLKA
ncbi:SUKH-4 family immunity protein [Nocardia suismassiliense]|uniref:SUKH-4 family immunity protein n=1 Tax=Nocardia suismassiliense TaxID=2077092 RepID=A0ABW6QLA2_9NOCA